MIFFTQEYLSLSFIHDIEIYNSHVQGFQILFLHFSVCTEYSPRSLYPSPLSNCLQSFARHLFHKSNSYFILGAMDSFARGLKNAAKLIEDGTLDALVRVS